MSLKHQLSDRLRRALEQSGLPWTLVHSARHVKIYVNGQFIGVTSRSGPDYTRRDANHICKINQLARSNGND